MCALFKTSLSKWTRKPSGTPSGSVIHVSDRETHPVSSPCDLQGYHPTVCSFLPRYPSIRLALLFPCSFQISGKLGDFGWRPKASQIRLAVSDVPTASEYRLPDFQVLSIVPEMTSDIPIDGPPRTLMISLDDPPSSDTGRM